MKEGDGRMNNIAGRGRSLVNLMLAVCAVGVLAANVASAQDYRIFIHAPGGDFSRSHEDVIINYQTWGGAQWTAKIVGDKFLHAPGGDFSRSHEDVIINYQVWGGAPWTAKLKAIQPPPPPPTPAEIAAGMVETVAELANNGELSGGTANALTASLEAAIASLATEDTKTAANQLNAFVNKVRAQSGKKVDAATADALVASAGALIEELGGTIKEGGKGKGRAKAAAQTTSWGAIKSLAK